MGLLKNSKTNPWRTQNEYKIEQPFFYSACYTIFFAAGVVAGDLWEYGKLDVNIKFCKELMFKK